MDRKRRNDVDRLLQSVLDRPVAERDVFLQRACHGDPQLERDVRSLLAAHDRAQAGKACLPTAQAESASLLRDRLEARIRNDQLCKSRLQIGIGVEEMSHVQFLSCPAEAEHPVIRDIYWTRKRCRVLDHPLSRTIPPRDYAATRFPLRTIAEWLFASRPCAVGTV